MISFLQRLRRRKVVSWSLAYLAGAWLTVQVTDVLGEKFLWPIRLQQGVIVLLAFGLPIVMVLAWYHGEKGRQRVSGPELFLIAGLLTVAGTVVALWDPPGPGTRDAAGPREATVSRLADSDLPSLAVLPFLPLEADGGGANSEPPADARPDGGDPAGDGPDVEADFFAAGIHDDLLTQLAKIGSLTVLSRTSVLQYRGTSKTIPTIGKELGVDAILEGGVRRAGDRIRVNVQLIDATTDEHLWAETYDRRLTVDEIFSIQGEIARLVTRELAVTLTGDEEERIGRATTGSLAAYELFLKAREAVRRRRKEDHERGIELFRAALAVDSTYARAWAVLGGAYAFRHLLFGAPDDWVDSARVAAGRALELEPELGEGYHALGVVHIVRGEFRRALELSLRAVELAPSFAAPVNNVGVLYHSLGQFDEAMAWIRRASRLSPEILFFRTNIAGLYIHLGDYERAKEILREVEEEDPSSPGLASQRVSLYRASHALDSLVVAGRRMVAQASGDPRAHFTAAAAALDGGRPEPARNHLSEALRLAPEGQLRDEDSHLGHTLAAFLAPEEEERARQLEAARRFVSGELERGTEDPWFRWETGTLRVLEGEPEDALRWFRRAFEAGWRDHQWPRIDPLLEDIRDEPRFVEILEEIRADVESQRRRVERRESAASLR